MSAPGGRPTDVPFEPDETEQLRRKWRAGEPLACPRCGTPLESSPAPAELGGAPGLLVLRCAPCRRAFFAGPEGRGVGRGD